MPAQQGRSIMRSLLVRSAAMVATILFVGLIAPPTSVKQVSLQSGFTTATPTTILHSTMTQDGRWKLGGDGCCYWDPDDSGDNQCSPATEAVEAPGTASVSAQLRSAQFHFRI